MISGFLQVQHSTDTSKNCNYVSGYNHDSLNIKTLSAVFSSARSLVAATERYPHFRPKTITLHRVDCGCGVFIHIRLSSKWRLYDISLSLSLSWCSVLTNHSVILEPFQVLYVLGRYLVSTVNKTTGQSSLQLATLTDSAWFNYQLIDVGNSMINIISHRLKSY